jgi:MurNAc alpha-1-phosphate uridylyltransferase
LKQALILAAGKGERMRPLTNSSPKPLLPIGGKPLIVWHIEKLAQAGITDLVINVSFCAEQIIAALGNGSAFGVHIQYSQEAEPLESGGGIAQALPLLRPDKCFALISADVFSDLDYQTLIDTETAHFVLVPASADLAGEFSLRGQHLSLDSQRNQQQYCWASVAVIHPSMCAHMPRGEKFKLMPHLVQWIHRQQVTAEVFHGAWENLTTPAQYLEAKHRYEQPTLTV